MRTGYGECVIEALDDGGPFADQAHYECVGKTGKRLLDKVDKGNADGKHTKKILAFMRNAAVPSMWDMDQWRAMFKDQDEEGTSICEFMKKQTTHDVIDHPSHYTWRGEESLEWLGGLEESYGIYRKDDRISGGGQGR